MSSSDPPLLISSSGRFRRNELAGFLASLEQVTRGKAISCLIADDAELRRLNRRFRGKNKATDVLSFPAEGDAAFAGDVAISADRARLQAAEHGHSFHDELRILMLHGALHLAGMDHECDQGQMRRAEGRWRRRFALPCGLIERSQESRGSGQ